MSRVYSYLRVSTDTQDLENQRVLISDYSSSHNLPIDEEISVEISSRKTLKDRRVSELVGKVRKGDSILVSELSRLGRSIPEISTLMRDFSKKGVNVHIIRQGIVTNGEQDISTKILITVLGLVSEIERDLISERTKMGLERVKREGKKLGNPNLHLINKRVHEHSVEWVETKRTIIESLVGKGLSQRKIVEELNTQGITTRQGKKWTLMGLQRCLKVLKKNK